MSEEITKMEEPERGIPPTMQNRRKSAQELLVIAMKIEKFITTDNDWNWCDMNQVYKILKACHE